MSKVFWVNKKGEEITKEKIDSHIALAKDLLENNRDLQNKYENRKNKNQSMTEFLIRNVG